MKIEELGNVKDNKQICLSTNELFETLDFLSNEIGEYIIHCEDLQKVDKIVCSASKTSCVIGFDGEVYPCVKFLGNRKFTGGNIKENTVKEIWNNSDVFKNFRKDRIENKKCVKCPNNSFCSKGCKAEAYFRYGDIRMIDGRC